jgi:hypothetical protein
MIEIGVDQWRVKHSFVLLAVRSLICLLVALSSVEIRDDERRIIVLHFGRCQTLFVAPQVSHFGHLNDGNFFGAANFLIFIGRCGRFTIWRANTLRKAFLHDAPLADAATCIVACFYF